MYAMGFDGSIGISNMTTRILVMFKIEDPLLHIPWIDTKQGNIGS